MHEGQLQLESTSALSSVARVLWLGNRFGPGFEGIQPYNMAYLAAYLEDICRLQMVILKPDQLEDIAQAVQDFEPDIVGLTAFATPVVPMVLKQAQAIKARRPNVMVITGGIGATFLADEILKSGCVDGVVQGEGELTLRELVQTGSPKGVQGLSYVCGGQLIHNPERPLIENLDDTRFAAMHLLDLSEMDVHWMEMSRGCRMQCAFCACPRFHRYRVRHKSPARIVEEIKYLTHCHDIQYLTATDDSIAQDAEWLTEVCELLIKEDLGLKMFVFAGARDLWRHPDLIPLMTRAGMKAIYLGIDSPQTLQIKEMTKAIGIDMDETRQVVQALKDEILLGGVIIGFPHETPEVMQKTAGFAMELGLDACHFAELTPFPGTRLYEQCESQDLFLTRDWSMYDQKHQIIKTPGWPEVSVEAMVHQWAKQFFFNSVWIQSHFTGTQGMRSMVARGNWRGRYLEADSFEEWQQIFEGYALVIDVHRTEAFPDYTSTVWLKTELDEMTLKVEKGRPALYEGKVGTPNLVLDMSNTMLNRLVGLMDFDALSAFLLKKVKVEGVVTDVAYFIRWIDAVQEAVAVQWPWSASGNPACLSELDHLIVDSPCWEMKQVQKRQNVLLKSETGNLLVRLKGREVTDLKLMGPGESPSKRIRDLNETSLEKADLAQILGGDLARLVEILANAV